MNLEEFKEEINYFINTVSEYALIKKITIDQIDEDEHFSTNLVVDCGEYGTGVVPIRSIKKNTELGIDRDDNGIEEILDPANFYAHLWIDTLVELQNLKEKYSDR